MFRFNTQKLIVLLLKIRPQFTNMKKMEKLFEKKRIKMFFFSVAKDNIEF